MYLLSLVQHSRPYPCQYLWIYFLEYLPSLIIHFLWRDVCGGEIGHDTGVGDGAIQFLSGRQLLGGWFGCYPINIDVRQGPVAKTAGYITGDAVARIFLLEKAEGQKGEYVYFVQWCRWKKIMKSLVDVKTTHWHATATTHSPVQVFTYLSNFFIGMPKLSTIDFLIVSSAVRPVWLSSVFLASLDILLKNSGFVTILPNASSNTPTTRTNYTDKYHKIPRTLVNPSYIWFGD